MNLGTIYADLRINLISLDIEIKHSRLTIFSKSSDLCTIKKDFVEKKVVSKTLDFRKILKIHENKMVNLQKMYYCFIEEKMLKG